MASLTAYYQALMDALDDRETVTLSGGSTTTAISAAWINGSTGVTSGLYAGRWLYNQTNVAQSKIASYVPGTGTQTVKTAMTANANANVVTLSGLFPVIHTLDAETDYRTIANRGLGRMMLSVPVTIAVTTSDRYSMVSYPSIIRPEQLLEVREPSPISGRSPVPSDRGWKLITGKPPYLQTERPFLTATGNLEVEWMRQASTWIAIAGTWAESTVGLANESDQAIPTVEDWLPFGLEEALTVLIARSPGRPSAEWARLLKQAQDDIARSPYRDRSAEPAPSPVQAA